MEEKLVQMMIMQRVAVDSKVPESTEHCILLGVVCEIVSVFVCNKFQTRNTLMYQALGVCEHNKTGLNNQTKITETKF